MHFFNPYFTSRMRFRAPVQGLLLSTRTGGEAAGNEAGGPEEKETQKCRFGISETAKNLRKAAGLSPGTRQGRTLVEWALHVAGRCTYRGAASV